VLARHLGVMWGADADLVMAGSGAAMQQQQRQQAPRLPVQIGRQQHGAPLQTSYQNGSQNSQTQKVFDELNTFLVTTQSQKETSQKLEQDCGRLKQVVADQNDKVQVSSPASSLCSHAIAL